MERHPNDNRVPDGASAGSNSWTDGPQSAPAAANPVAATYASPRERPQSENVDIGNVAEARSMNGQVPGARRTSGGMTQPAADGKDGSELMERIALAETKDGVRTTLEAVFEALINDEDHLSGLSKVAKLLKEDECASWLRFYYEELLSRCPEDGVRAQARVDSPLQTLLEILQSDEFSARMPEIFMKQNPKLKREFYIHIPKTGGTTLLTNLKNDSRYIDVPDIEYVKSHVSDRLKHIADLARAFKASKAERVFVNGHLPCSYIKDYDLKRGYDEVYALVRHPLDVAVSNINYILTQLDQDTGHPLNAERREKLGLYPGEPIHPLELLPPVIEKLLQPDMLCSWFGREATWLDAVNTAGILDIHFVFTSDLNKFMSFKGLPATAHLNVSHRYVTFASMDRACRLNLMSRVEEDLKFYSYLERSRTPAGGPCYRIIC